MPGWVIGIIVVLVAGIGVIAYGYFRDKELNRRRSEQILGQPERAIPGYDRGAHHPTYVTERQAHQPPEGAKPALTAEELAVITGAIGSVTPLQIGYARKELANDAESARVALIDPLVLICAEPVEAIRELLPLIDQSRRLGAAIALVAPKISTVVLDTLVVNHIQQFLGVVAIQTESLETQFAIAELTGAAIVDRSDLMSGYLPPDRLGRCAYWVSTARQTWIVSSPTQ